MTPFFLSFRAPIIAIQEHHRTIRGRRDPASGQALIEHINLGWFIHLDFNGTPISFSTGHERPPLEVGNSIIVQLLKE